MGSPRLLLSLLLASGVSEAGASCSAPARPGCRRPEVLIDSGRTIRKDGDVLGGPARGNFTASCSGVVAWMAQDGGVYKDAVRLGAGASFGAAEDTGDVAWIGADGRMHKNDEVLGPATQQPASFQIADNTGEVAWATTDGRLFKDREPLGGHTDFVQSYAIARFHRGEVAWSSRGGRMFKDGELLSAPTAAVKSFQVNHRTGDVVWLSRSGDIYRDEVQLNSPSESNIQEFSLSPDGSITWARYNGGRREETSVSCDGR